MTANLEQRARELMAAELCKIGFEREAVQVLVADFAAANTFGVALRAIMIALKGQPASSGWEENPCAKIFDHKWLDPVCVEDGCQSRTLTLAVQRLSALIWAARTSGGVAGRDDGLVAECEAAEAFLAARPSLLPSPPESAAPELGR